MWAKWFFALEARWKLCQRRHLWKQLFLRQGGALGAGDRSVKTNPTSTMVDFQQMVNSPKTDWPNFDSTISQLIRKPINQCHGWTYSDRTILHLNKFQFNNEFNNEFNNSTNDTRIFQGPIMESIGSAWRNAYWRRAPRSKISGKATICNPKTFHP